MPALLDTIKKDLRPAKELLAVAQAQVDRINQLLKQHKLVAVCVMGGSVAKDTFLKNDHDIDLFVRFNISYPTDKLADLLEPVIAPLRPSRVHGSRDYFQYIIAAPIPPFGNVAPKIQCEVVPVYDIARPELAVNVTDCSPLHVAWVRKHLTKKPSLSDEIRLTKQFLKAHNIYGAESYISGFSGHIVDILIINYGSFLKLLRAAAAWPDKVIIDVEHHLKDPIHELNAAKVYNPLILVDPLQKERNAAAALSKEKFDVFRKAAASFLKRPSARQFVIRKPSLDDIPVSKNCWTVAVRLVPLEGKRDVVGAKILSVYNHILRALAEHDFKVSKHAWSFDMMYFIIQKKKLSTTVVHMGPPLDKKDDVAAFRKKHPAAKTSKNRMSVALPRQYVEPVALVRDVLKNNAEKVKSYEL